MVERFRIRNTPAPGRREALPTPVVVPTPERMAPASVQRIESVTPPRTFVDTNSDDDGVSDLSMTDVVHGIDTGVRAVTPVVQGGYWVLDKALTPVQEGIAAFGKKLRELPIIKHIYNLRPFGSGGAQPKAQSPDHGHGH